MTNIATDINGGASYRAAGAAQAPVRRVADWLGLAACPTFAAMALLTGLTDEGPLNALCSGMHGGLPLTGMVPMYLLMSVFHSAPWLKLILSR